MNIKYRLLCKRLIEERKRVGVIQYYNVLFIMELLSDKDIWFLEQWVNGISNIYMKDIHNWCRMHFVKYHTVFVYRKEYPVKANIWNGYSYIRWRMERMMNWNKINSACMKGSLRVGYSLKVWIERRLKALRYSFGRA